MHPQSFYGKRPHPLLWAGLQAACGKITISGKPNCLNYFEIFITNKFCKCGCDPNVGDLCLIHWKVKQLTASLHLWKSNMMVKIVLIIISHYFKFPWIKYKWGLYEICFLRPEAVSFCSTLMKLRRDANFYLHAPYIMIWCLRTYCINKIGPTFTNGNIHSACKFFLLDLYYISYTLKSK